MGNEFVYVGVADVLHVIDEVAHAMSVHRVSKPQFGFNLVALGDCNFAHVVAKTCDLQLLRIVPPTGRTQPDCDDHFPPHASPAGEKTKLAIAVCRLIEVHEVHVDRRPWQLAVELGMKMHKWLT